MLIYKRFKKWNTNPNTKVSNHDNIETKIDPIRKHPTSMLTHFIIAKGSFLIRFHAYRQTNFNEFTHIEKRDSGDGYKLLIVHEPERERKLGAKPRLKASKP